MKHVLSEDTLEGTGFTGLVEIDIPMHHERIQLQKELAQLLKGTDEDGVQFDQAIFFSKVAHKHVLGLKLVHVDSKSELSTIEEFFACSESANLIYKIGAAVVRGNLLGKK